MAKNLHMVFNKRINFKSNKSIEQVDTFYDLIFPQKHSKDNSMRPEKDSHTGPSKASSFSRNELKANSKKFVGLDNTSNKMKSHMRRAKNKSIHFIKSNYSEGSGIMTPKLNLSQKKITAQIYEKSKKIKTHDRSKTGLSHIDKSIFGFDKINARSSRGHRELGSFKHASLLDKEPRSLRTSEHKPLREKLEDPENIFKGVEAPEEPEPIEEHEEFPIEKKELSCHDSSKKEKPVESLFEDEKQGSAVKKILIFSEINNRLQESGAKKLSIVNNSALVSSEAKKPLEIKKMLKKLNRLQSPQFELRKNNIPGLLHMSKYFKTEPFSKPEKSTGRKKWFTEEHKPALPGKNRSSFLRKIFQEKPGKSRQPTKSLFDSWKNKPRKPKNKSFCRENKGTSKANLFKSQIMLGMEKMSSKSGGSGAKTQAEQLANASIAYTRKAEREQPNYQIDLDSFRKISKDSPIRKQALGKSNVKKNVFKWQSGSKDSLQLDEHAFVSKPKDFISKNTITPEFIKPPKPRSGLRKASNQVLFSPEFKAKPGDLESGPKGLSLNVSRRKSRQGDRRDASKGSKVNIKNFLAHKKKRLKSSKHEKTESKRGNQSLMLNAEVTEADAAQVAETVQSKKRRSLLKTMNKAKSRTPRHFEPPKNRSMVLEGNWGQLGRAGEDQADLKKKYRTNDNLKSSSKKSKCKSMLPHLKGDSSDHDFDHKLPSFFRLQSEETEDRLGVLKYESSCKSESFNELNNIETDIQIPDFVNVYTEEASHDTETAPKRDSRESEAEAQERVTKNKFKSRQGRIQVPKDLLQQLKSQEDNFSSQTVTSNKKKKRLMKVGFKGGATREGAKGVPFSKRKRPHGAPHVKKLRIETRYKSNQNPSKVDFSKYGSAKGTTEKTSKPTKSMTQKLNLKKFMGKKSFNRKNSENNSQKRTSSALISSDGFNISRKYAIKTDMSMNQSGQKPLPNEAPADDPRAESPYSTENKLVSCSESEARRDKKGAKRERPQAAPNSSFDKKKGWVQSRLPKKSSAHLRKKTKVAQIQQLKKMTLQRLPASLLDPSKIPFLGRRKRPPKKNKNRPPRLPKKSKTTKNRFYETDNPFEKRKYFKSKVHYTDKREKPGGGRRITDLAQIEGDRRGYTSGGFGQPQTTPSGTSKNFSKRSNLKYELGKIKSSKVNLKSRESNLFSNEHNFIGHTAKAINKRRGSKNFNSHQVSKKNNDPTELDKETSLTSSNFQKKYVIDFETEIGIGKPKHPNKADHRFKKHSILKSEHFGKGGRKLRMAEEPHKSRKNHPLRLPQNLSKISNSKISNSRLKDNFSQLPSKKANRAFKKPKSSKNRPVMSKKKVKRGQFQSNPSKVSLKKMISPTLTSIDLEPAESVTQKEKYKLEDTNNIYVDNYMRNMRDCKGKGRKNSAQALSQISLNPKQIALSGYLNDNLQGFSNIYNLKNRKKKSQISNEVSSTKNLGYKKDYSSQSSFYNVPKNLSDNRALGTADSRRLLVNQTSLLEKDFRRKTDLGSFQRVHDARLVAPQRRKVGLSKKSKKMYPVNQSSSFYYSKKNLNQGSLTQDSPTQNSWNYSNNSFNFSKGQMMVMGKKKLSGKKP